MTIQTGPPLNSGPGFVGIDIPRDEDLYRCVHCGLCLSSCPTYLETNLETESPRGRIALMKAVKEGRLGISQRVASHWDLCLQCRACEAVCPSGVPFGRLMESTRAQLLQHRKESWRLRLVKALFLRGALPHPTRLKVGASIFRAYQRWGLQTLVRKARLLNLLLGNLAQIEAGLPSFSQPFFGPAPDIYPARRKARMVVGLLSGCVMPLVHGETMRAAVRVLTRNDCDVAVPPGQGCCGALNLHSGDIEMGRRMARRNIDVFLNAGVDRIVVVSAGCGSAMKEYQELLKDDPEYRDKAKLFSGITVDVSELLVALSFDPPQRRGQNNRNLPGLLPSSPCSAHCSSSQGHPRVHTWAGPGGDGGSQPVLRRRRYLLYNSAGVFTQAPGEQNDVRSRHRSGHIGHGQPRVHDTTGDWPPSVRNTWTRTPPSGYFGRIIPGRVVGWLCDSA